MYEIELTKKGMTATCIEAIIVRTEVGESRLGIGIIMAASALVGVWGVTCLISGLSQVASMQELFRSITIGFTGI
ncbi:MAG: hypothetical protein A2521_00265 [Deltaproteobacteria bacterium RIFOXYD12_FULL_57_12]|nr:MAG: hypothetical protein A2521_00265 [Deltaproteobacteria bacterium RIFOXYD12_FULL_57_12]